MNSEELLGFHKIKENLSEHCSSMAAKDLAAELTIMTDKSAIEEALMETKEAMISLEGEVEQPIGGTRDIRKALSRAKKEMILAKDELWDIYVTLEAYKRMQHFFAEKYLNYPMLSLWVQDIANHDHVERKFRTVFDDKGEVKDSASPKLQQLRNTIYNTKDRLKKELQNILTSKENQKYFQEAIVTQRNNRYVIPVKQEYRYAFDGIVHDKSATGATLYIEPMVMVKLNNDLQEAIVEEEREVLRIFKELSQYIKNNVESLTDACRRVTHIEFVYGKASYALSYKGIVPRTNDSRKVKLVDARHPLLPKNSVVPTTILLGEEYKVLLITGSNTGGKTVSLKTMGLLSMMHQAGLCIPANQESELPVFGEIYADIGDEQSIEESLSTFSGHMTQIKRIMESVGPNDLVLIDELGSGTDPEEGSALAVAIMEYFLALGPLMMVTTHYNDLKNFAYETDEIENGHVEFDEKTLRPTYKLRIGVAGSSHAFSIAERLGLPKKVVMDAKEYKAGSRHSDMEEILSQLNEQLRQANMKEERLQKEVEQAKALRDKAQRELKKVEDKKKAILDKAKDDAYALKRSLRQETEQIIKELKSQFSEKDAKKRAQAMQDARKQVSDIPVPETMEKRKKVKAEQLKVGDSVYVKNLQAVGTIAAIEGKRYKVEVNGLPATVKLTDLAEASPDETIKARREATKENRIGRRRANRANAVIRQQNATTEINLLGQRVDEGIMNVSRFIDQSVLAGLASVRIIHGKGTGALREGIHDYLRTLPMVKHFEQASYENGGAGATVVYFK